MPWDDLIGFRNRKGGPTYLVLPAGNSYRSRGTARMVLERGQSKWLEWVMLPDDRTPNFVEIWLDRDGVEEPVCPIELTLTPPKGSPQVLRGMTDDSTWEFEISGSVVARVYYEPAGTVGATFAGAGDPSIVVKYPQGEKRIVISPNAHVVRNAFGSKDDLKAGAAFRANPAAKAA